MSFTGMMMAAKQSLVEKIVVISVDSGGWNLITEAYGGVAPTSPEAVTITQNSGINVATLDLRGLPDGSTVRYINLGKTYGLPGNGGDGRGSDGEDGT